MLLLILGIIRDGDKILRKLKLNVHNAAERVTLGEIGRYEFMPADIEFVDKGNDNYET